MYYAIVYPYLNYGILAWGSASSSHINRLYILQKRAIRIMSHAPYLAHTNPLFIELDVLRFYDIHAFQVLIFMYLCNNNLLPDYIKTFFKFNQDVHGYNTRNAKDFHLPKPRLSSFKNSILFQGPQIWNSVSIDIKQSVSLNVFKSRSRQFILNSYSSSSFV